MLKFFGIKIPDENYSRRLLIFCCHLIIFIRMAITMFVLVKRRIPWAESIAVPLAFALYYIGFSFLVLPSDIPVGAADLAGILIFISGCWLNTGGELLRARWKKSPGNVNRLYTGGYFRFSRHINYFGDVLWVTGYAMLSCNWWAFIIPVFLYCFFVFYNAPKLDQYLRKKYGADFEEYARKTPMLVPFKF